MPAALQATELSSTLPSFRVSVGLSRKPHDVRRDEPWIVSRTEGQTDARGATENEVPRDTLRQLTRKVRAGEVPSFPPRLCAFGMPPHIWDGSQSLQSEYARL